MSVVDFSDSQVWQRAYVQIPHIKARKSFLQRSYILHIPSGEMFLDEPRNVTRIKCALIAMSAPVFAAMRFGGYLFRAMLDIYILSHKHFVSCKIFSDSCCKELRDLFKTRVVEDISQAALSIIVMIFEIFWGAIGIVEPWLARRELAKNEKKYLNDIAYKQEFCFFSYMLEEKKLYSDDLFSLITHNDAMFHAPCFQSVGNANQFHCFNLIDIESI
jgi:hypothetical protein